VPGTDRRTPITVPVADGNLPCHLAEPAGGGPWPAVVVLHDFTGMSADLRRQAGWLAGAGFLAAAPNLFHRGNRWSCLRTMMRDIGARRGPTFDDVEAVRVMRGCAHRQSATPWWSRSVSAERS
jgi:carboxymethylenebutenolidase